MIPTESRFRWTWILWIQRMRPSGTPVRGGVTYREAHLAMEMIARLRGHDFLEVWRSIPILDEHNRTALLE